MGKSQRIELIKLNFQIIYLTIRIKIVKIIRMHLEAIAYIIFGMRGF